MWWSVGVHQSRRCAAERGERPGSAGADGAAARKTTYDQVKDTDEYRELLRRKYGSVLGAWHEVLDPGGSGSLEFVRFAQTARAIGYVGNLRALWYNLSCGEMSTLSLYELDKDGAAALDKFRFLCTSRFGTLERAWRECIDKERASSVPLPEFLRCARELGYDEDEGRSLFDFLRVRQSRRSISYHDVEFLQRWEERKRDAKDAARLKTGWVNRCMYLDLGVGDGSGVRRASATDEDGQVVTKVVRADMDRAKCQAAAFSAHGEFDHRVAADGEDRWENFLDFLRGRYKSMPQAFEALDQEGRGYLSLRDFQVGASRILAYCRASEARRLFELVSKDGRPLTWPDFGVTATEWSNHLMEKRAAEQKRQAPRGLPGGPAAAPRPRSAAAAPRPRPTSARPGSRPGSARRSWIPNG